eukprot:356586-Chlamydomonas_euryale.AAC.3
MEAQAVLRSRHERHVCLLRGLLPAPEALALREGVGQHQCCAAPPLGLGLVPHKPGVFSTGAPNANCHEHGPVDPVHTGRHPHSVWPPLPSRGLPYQHAARAALPDLLALSACCSGGPTRLACKTHVSRVSPQLESLHKPCAATPVAHAVLVRARTLRVVRQHRWRVQCWCMQCWCTQCW